MSASYALVVGRAFRFMREARGVKLGVVAKAVRLTVSGWSRVETGDTTMTVLHLRAAADAIGATPAQVLDAAEQEWTRQRTTPPGTCRNAGERRLRGGSVPADATCPDAACAHMGCYHLGRA